MITPQDSPATFPRGIRPIKFSIPPRAADHLRRPRLLDFLHENVHRKLNLIAAAAGYGKTALLADFAHDTDYRVAWCRLDDADRDLVVLAADLVSALRHAFPTFESALRTLDAEARANPEALALSLARDIEAGLDEYFVLALDDFHLVEDSAPALQFLDVLLENLPEQAHLLIAGRTIPPLRLAVLAAQQQVAGLSEEHLRFTPAEAQQLIELRNRVALPQSEAESLVANTEGWITGILLTTHLMWRGLMAQLIQARQSQSPLYDYLAAEVLDQQPEPLRQFLLESAVLPEMEPAVCDAVLGRADSDDMLRQAESRHLFISAVGDEFRAYQYHHLFRDFLLDKFHMQNPDRLKSLQARAAEWFAANGMAEAAVTFFIAAGQLAKAAEAADANARAIFTAGRHAALRQWAEQLKPIAMDTPRLHLYLALADSDAGQLSTAEDALEIAAVGFARCADEEGVVRVETQRSLLLYRRGEFEKALAMAQAVAPKAHSIHRTVIEALALRYAGMCQFAMGQLATAEESLTRSVQSLQSTQFQYDLALVLGDLAAVLRARGQTARAARAQQQALAIWRKLSTPGPLALALNNIGWDLHMLGQYESALSTYREALEWARRAGGARLEVVILAGQADLHADIGDRAQAVEVYRNAMAKAEQAGDWALAAYLCRAMARLDRWSGNFVGALEWLRRAALAAGQGKAESALANVDGLRGIILVEVGRAKEGRELLDKVCSELEQSGAMVDLAQTLLYRACAEFRDGDVATAERSLTRALAAAEQVGYDQMLVSEALALRDMLTAFLTRSDIGPRIAGLLSRAERVRSLRETLDRSGEAVSLKSKRAAVIQVRALGQRRVTREGAEVSSEESISQRIGELFFFLADRAPVARDRILETFWADKPLARAANNLYQMLFRLRRAIGLTVFVLEDQECRLAPDVTLDYDVARFESEARRALALAPSDLNRLGTLASAINLYTGDYLADLQADWTLERRRELGDLYVDTLQTYADELMNLTRYAEARAVLERAVAIEPFRDELHERMLVCLAGLGRRHEVVAHYRRYRETLRAELGLDPPPEMRALYSRLIE